jgi:hypothetical protein
MIDNSPGHTYIKPDLSDVNLLKVSIIDGNDDTVISHMELTTNVNAAIYQKNSMGRSPVTPEYKKNLQYRNPSQSLYKPHHQPTSINDSIKQPQWTPTS